MTARNSRAALKCRVNRPGFGGESVIPGWRVGVVILVLVEELVNGEGYLAVRAETAGADAAARAGAVGAHSGHA